MHKAAAKALWANIHGFSPLPPLVHDYYDLSEEVLAKLKVLKPERGDLEWAAENPARLMMLIEGASGLSDAYRNGLI